MDFEDKDMEMAEELRTSKRKDPNPINKRILSKFEMDEMFNGD